MGSGKLSAISSQLTSMDPTRKELFAREEVEAGRMIVLFIRKLKADR